MNIKRKMKLLGIFTYKDKIVLHLPKLDEELPRCLSKLHTDIGLPSDTINLEFDILFNEIHGTFFIKEWEKYETYIFVDDTYLFVIIRFPKKDKQKVLKIIDDNFFLPDKEHKDI
ncbi:MAG: hypothetical protein QXJ06_04185, partial [Candidatus Aenigmatarchaeota archaeon]